MRSFGAAVLFYLVALAICVAVIYYAPRAHAQELVARPNFQAAFTARNQAGRREHFVIPMIADNGLQCMTGALGAALDWLRQHPDYSEPRDAHCARDGEADL
jgi:hypothetical protein